MPSLVFCTGFEHALNLRELDQGQYQYADAIDGLGHRSYQMVRSGPVRMALSRSAGSQDRLRRRIGRREVRQSWRPGGRRTQQLPGSGVQGCLDHGRHPPHLPRRGHRQSVRPLPRDAQQSICMWSGDVSLAGNYQVEWGDSSESCVSRSAYRPDL
jgi:hypothetical protein